MAQIQIKPKNILEPSEKVLRMYEAVHSFMLEKRDISTIKVQALLLLFENSEP